jgi:tetratricopeptide (TPR) repeat protein
MRAASRFSQRFCDVLRPFLILDLSCMTLMAVLITPASAIGQEAVGQPAKISQILEEAGAIVNALPDTGDLEKHYPVRRWKVDFYTDLARIQAKAGDRDGLNKSAQRAAKSAQGSPEFLLALSSIARNQIEAGNRDGADDTLKQMFMTMGAIDHLDLITDKDEAKDTAMLIIASVQTEVEQPEQALDTVNKIKNDRDRAHALVNLARSRSKKGDRNGAAGLLQQALQTANEMNDSTESAWVLVEIARAQAEAGDPMSARATVAQAGEAIREVGEAKARAGLFQVVAQVETSIGDREAAREASPLRYDRHTPWQATPTESISWGILR